jgi:hypothetical protein
MKLVLFDYQLTPLTVGSFAIIEKLKEKHLQKQ